MKLVNSSSVTTNANAWREKDAHSNKISIHLPSAEILGVNVMAFEGKTSLVSVGWYSRLLTLDFKTNATSDEVMVMPNNNVREFTLTERIISDNRPYF